MSIPKRIDIITAADPDAAGITQPLPCGCHLPFHRCAVADELLAAEWTAGDAMLRIGALPGATPDDYAQARGNWRAAIRAYDAHIGRVDGPIAK